MHATVVVCLTILLFAGCIRANDATNLGAIDAGVPSDGGGSVADGGVGDAGASTVVLSPAAPQVGFAALTNNFDPDNPLTLRLGNIGGLSTENYSVFEAITPSESGSATWYSGVSHTLFHGTRLDQVVTMGWNLKPNGTRFDVSDAAIGDQWESYFEQDSSTTWLERHWVFINTDGSYQRPLSCQIQRGGAHPGFTNCFIASDYLAIAPHTANSAPDFTFQSPPTGENFFGVANQADIRLFTNNKPQLLQLNVAGNALLTLAYIDAADMVHVGGREQKGVTLDGTTTTIAGNAALNGLLSLTNGFAAYVGPTSKVPASPWTLISLMNGWTSYDGGAQYARPSYFKDSNGVVHLKGMAKNGGSLAASIAQLPPGYRPLQNLQIANVSNGAPGYLTISSDGQLVQQVGATTWISLDGVSFLAEQ